MKISIEQKLGAILIYDRNKYLGKLVPEDFFELLDTYQTDAYEDGELNFSINENQLNKKITNNLFA
jgi:hypothetical protein